MSGGPAPLVPHCFRRHGPFPAAGKEGRCGAGMRPPRKLENVQVLIEHIKAAGVIAEIQLAVGRGKALQYIVVAGEGPSV